MIDQLNDLMKALEAGSYSAAPGSLVQGSALQTEDLSPVMENVTFEDKHLKLQKMIPSVDAKATLIQFNRQLDYGIFGGSAQMEGGIGEEDTSSYARITVPMCYYSEVRRVSIAANMVATSDSKKAEDRVADDAAIDLAADIEFDLFRGNEDFSNAGVFDGNPLAMAKIPNMIGVNTQIRQSDVLTNTQDLMFAEYGSEQSVVLGVNGNLTQSVIEDSSVRSAMNHGSADSLIVDPLALSAYNKISHAKERIFLSGSAQEASGAELRKQWTSSALVTLEASRFLSGKTAPARARAGSPSAPAAVSGAATSGGNMEAGSYYYYITSVNERGESVKSVDSGFITVADGDKVTIANTIFSGISCKYFNVYRGLEGGKAAFIGRVNQGIAASNGFLDLGNKIAGSSNGYLLDKRTMKQHQLAPFTSLDLAVTNLSLPKAFYRFLTVSVKQPRKNVILDNISGFKF